MLMRFDAPPREFWAVLDAYGSAMLKPKIW
jgi:hypothetical protein